MGRDRGRRTGVDVRGRTQLQRNPPVADIGGETAEQRTAVRIEADVIDDPDAVAEPFGPQVERLADQRQAIAFAGVQGEVEAGRDEAPEDVGEAARRIARLRTGDVEADHAGVAMTE